MPYPVDVSVISPEALLARIAPRYKLTGSPSCRLFVRGLNDTYLLRAGTRSYFLRVYQHEWRKKSAIEAEVDMLNDLARQKLPVSHPIRKRDGGYLTRVAGPEGLRYAALFSEAPGAVPEFNIATCRQYGTVVANIHAATDRRAEDPRRFHLDLNHLIDEPLRYIAPFLNNRPDDLAYLRTIGAQLCAGVESLLDTSRPYYGCCHGDHHGANVHKDAQGRMVVFDFDCFGYGWRAYDAAVFLWQLAHVCGWSRTGKAKVTRRWNAFTSGYAETRPLTANEQLAAKLFVAIRQIWFMGLHARMTRIFGDVMVAGRYFDHQIGFVKQAVQHYRLDAVSTPGETRHARP